MFRAFSRLLPGLLLLTRVAVAQPLPDRVPVVGSAVDRAGKPLAGALITLRRQNNLGSFTFWGAVTAADARGAWRFPNAESGEYFLSAEMPGFAPISNQIVKWRLGAAPLRLTFEKLVALRLKITNSSGAALANAPLWVRMRGDGEVGQITRRAVTDEGGEVRLDELLPATYELFLAAPDGFATQNRLDLRADRTLDLGLQRGGKLLISALQSGEGARKLGGATLNLTLETEAEARRLLGEAANPRENVAFLASGGEDLALISRDGDGEIAVSNLPPGRYVASLRLAGYRVPETQTVTIVAGETAFLPFDFTPSGGAALTLQLKTTNETGATVPAPAREWSLRILPIDKNGMLAPEAREENAFFPLSNFGRRAMSDASGQITLFPLRAGRYRVSATPRALPIEGEAPEPPSLDLDVPPGGATATLQVPQTP